jgi:hypothetical protein
VKGSRCFVHLRTPWSRLQAGAVDC